MKNRLTVGIITDEPHLYRSSEVIRGIASQAFRCGCDVVVLSSMYYMKDAVTQHQKNSREIYNLILAENFDGFIYDRKYMYCEEVRKYVEDLLVKSGKNVIIPDDTEHSIFDNTAFDDSKAFENIATHLITEHGCRKIYCLTGPKDAPNAEERLQGYKNAMEKHGLDYEDSWCIYGDYWKKSAVKLAADIASGILDRPDAVMCGNDITAETLIGELEKHGIKVPQDTAVFGFDHDPHRIYSSYDNISSYIRENFQIGCEAFRSLYRLITGKLCRKISYENFGLLPGTTCGCSVTGRNSAKRKLKVDLFNNRMIRENNYLMELTTCSTVEEAAPVISKMAYRIRNYCTFATYVTEDYLKAPFIAADAELKLRAGQTMVMHLKTRCDGTSVTNAGNFSSDCLVPELYEKRKKPSLYYLTPLHFNKKVYGYAALSFGKKICTYSHGYTLIISSIATAMEHYRQNISNANLTENYRTEKISRMPFIYNINDICSSPVFGNSDKEKHITVIQLITGNTALAKLRFQEFCCYIRDFTSQITENTRKNEICGCIFHSVFCIVSENPNRTPEIFKSLSDYFSSVKLSDKYGTGLSFRVGSFSDEDLKTCEFDECVRLTLLNPDFEYCENFSTSSGRLYEQLCLLRSEIASHPENDWHIESICEQLAVSPSHFHKKYKNYFGKSLFDEIIEQRINKACSLLNDSKKTVAAISEDCGYSSYCYFTKQFKKIMGISPSEYRTSLRESKQDNTYA